MDLFMLGPVDVLSVHVTIGLCVLWMCFWLAAHLVLPPRVVLTRRPRVGAVDTSAASGVASSEVKGAITATVQGSDLSNDCAPASNEMLVRYYQRKLRRMQIYCVLAAGSGFFLFAYSFSSPEPVEEMLVAFGPAHQVFFSMAVGHWVVNLWEDWCTRGLLAPGMDGDDNGAMALFPFNLCCTPSQVMFSIYILHHTITIFAYGFSLVTHSLGGVMVQGLLFEFPVIFTLRRELAISQEDSSGWNLDVRALRRNWWLIYLAFALGRGPAEVLWVVSFSLDYGRERLSEHLDDVGIVVYHTLAVFFTSLNMRIFILLCYWHANDVRVSETNNKPVKDSYLVAEDSVAPCDVLH